MNKNLGTTIIVTSPSENYLKNFVSVLIYLDNGNISKIRAGFMKKPFKKNNNRKKGKPSKKKRYLKNHNN